MNGLKKCGLLLLLLFASSAVWAQSHSVETVWKLHIKGAISPASADYFISNLQRAERQQVDLLILQLNTPGGLDASMRDMIQAILSSEVPVVTYVALSGARAASAGTYLLTASHVAAMAPATNVGSSTPVQMKPPMGLGDSQDKKEEASDSAMDKKVLNDAVSYLKSLAELRGRNVEWAEETVREAANLSARDALEAGVIDLLAVDLDDLLVQLDGFEIQSGSSVLTLSLQNPEVTVQEPGWRYDFLSLITNPNIAYLLLMIGVYGLILEFYNPGTAVAGVIGVICLVLAGFALQMLPISYAGLALLIIGIVLMAAEAVTPSFGIMGIGGLIAFVLGSVFLMDSELPGYQISVSLIAAISVTTAALCVFVVGAALRARAGHVVSGQEAMIGERAEARDDFAGIGRVYAMGEVWQAYSKSPVKKGQTLTIRKIEGLILHVEPTKEH